MLWKWAKLSFWVSLFLSSKYCMVLWLWLVRAVTGKHSLMLKTLWENLSFPPDWHLTHNVKTKTESSGCTAVLCSLVQALLDIYYTFMSVHTRILLFPTHPPTTTTTTTPPTSLLWGMYTDVCFHWKGKRKKNKGGGRDFQRQELLVLGKKALIYVCKQSTWLSTYQVHVSVWFCLVQLC